MRVRIGLLLWLPTLLCISGLEESEAGVVDWHQELVGVPVIDSVKTLPAFIRSDPTSPVKKTGIAVVTKSNVLSVINPGSSGNVAWRRVFDKSEGPVLQYKTHRDAMATLSGLGGSHIRLFESFTGSLLWERQLHKSSLGRLLEPPTMGVDIAFWRDVRDIDAYVLTNAHTVTRLEGKTGKTLWSWASDDISILVSRIVLSDTYVHAIGLVKTGELYALNVVTLDRETGAFVSENGFPLASHQAGTLRSVVINSPDDFMHRLLSTDVSFSEVHDIGLADNGLFVADVRGASSWVIGMESTGLKQVWELSDASPISKAETPSKFSGGTNREGRPYIARLFWSHTTGLANIHFYVPHGAGGQGLSTGFMFAFDTSKHGVITHCAIDAFMANEYSVQHRLLLTTSTGAVQLWQREELQWTRDEALADIALATLVDLPERKIVSELGMSEHRGFSDRLFEHLVATQYLPQYVTQFAKRFATGSYASSIALASSALERDAFGFRKSMPSSVAYHFEALTGRLVGNGRATGHQISDHAIAEAFLVPGESGAVGVVSVDGKVHIYPSSANTSSFQNKTASLYFTLAIGSELHGHNIYHSSADSHFRAAETWRKAFTSPAVTPNTVASSLSVIHRPTSPVASYGKVLGDRTTLYKYLSPHAAVVLASDCAVRVVDLVSGAITFDSGCLGVAGGECVKPQVVFVENWLVYAYEVGGNATDKGTQIVSVELYEGSGKDDKTSSPDVSSFSESSSRVHAIQQSFLFPYPVVALGTTATKFGISTKGLLVPTSKNQIYNLHRRMLDPRRPMQKPSAEEQEEMLMQYDAVLPPETRRVITHKNQVLGVEHIITSPTLLESTSCVFAYGLDLFHTRVTPSGTFDLLGSGFNKAQLVLAIVGLSVAIAVVRPLVTRKQLHARWYA